MTVRTIRVVSAIRVFLRRQPLHHAHFARTKPASGKVLVQNIGKFHKLTPEDIEDLNRISRANRQDR
jgi:hypothetical protein